MASFENSHKVLKVRGAAIGYFHVSVPPPPDASAPGVEAGVDAQSSSNQLEALAAGEGLYRKK